MNFFTSFLSLRLIAGVIIAISLCAFAYADDSDGTYRLVKRELPDGTVLTPPAVQGMGTFKNSVYQLIVFWPTPEGKPASLSSISKWEWSDTEVAATPLLVVFDDGSGQLPVYTVGGETKRVPLTRQGARLSYQHPLDPVFVVWEGDRFTATIEGAFVDHWEKVK